MTTWQCGRPRVLAALPQCSRGDFGTPTWAIATSGLTAWAGGRGFDSRDLGYGVLAKTGTTVGESQGHRGLRWPWLSLSSRMLSGPKSGADRQLPPRRPNQPTSAPIHHAPPPPSSPPPPP